MQYNLSKSKDLFEKKKEYIFQATFFNEAILEKGKGNYVYDIDGNKYLDLNSGQFCLSFGHKDKNLAKVVSKQINKIYHTNTSTISPEVLQACEDIASITGGNLKKTIFLSTGSEANECAMRYARFITQKSGIISFSKGYHGLTLGAQHVTMSGKWARPTCEENYYIDHDCDIQTLKNQFTDILKKSNNNIAAVIIEPILAVAGIYIPTEEYLKELRELCDKNQILLIFDECQTGFGRTGKWFCYQHYDIEPDILTCAKAMGLGFAVSSVTFKTDVAKKIEGKIVHFSSHQNDPLSCVITSYMINRMKKNKVLNHITSIGTYFEKKLKELELSSRIIKNVRGKGLIYGFDISDDLMQKNPNFSKEFLFELQKNGVLLQAIRQGRTCRLSPSYIITKKNIDYLIDKIRLTEKNICF